MKIIRNLFIGFEIVVVFAIVWLLVQLPELTAIKEFGQRIEQPYGWIYFWQDLTIFILAVGTSMLFWKRYGWSKPDKARYFCLFAGIFSLFSLLIVVTAIRTDSLNFWLLGLFIFFITSLLITTAIHYITLQAKLVWFESLKIIFLGMVVFEINFFSIDFVSRPNHNGETGLSILVVAIVFGALAFITSLIINFTLLKKLQRRKI